MEAGVEQLLLTHLPPFTPGLEALVAEAAQVFERVELALDGVGVPVLVG